jgi:hypothetical protein
VIFDLKRANALETYECFKNMSLEDLFFFNTEDLVSPEKRLKVINKFLLKNGLIDHEITTNSKDMTLHSVEYIINIIDILITPTSYWHNHDKDIIWFDMKKLDLMEKWVSDKIGKPFILKQVNTSQHIECQLKLDENFKKRYNEVYDFYDLPKEKITLI